MRKLIGLVALASLIGWSDVAFSDQGDGSACPTGQKLKLIGAIKTGATMIGNLATSDGPTISNRGQDVRMIIVNCSGTACVVGIADATQIGAAVAGDYKIEPGAAANATIVIDLTKTPLSFSNGISVADTSGNTNNVSVYSCQ